ncbi:MAG: alpha-E domain-containing protein [Phycisphaerales bacterium]|nr:alpha-E domain-containing protein [Phycisphaerales bacterium]
MTAMLSRSAENIYWMGRYLERAAFLCRSLKVAEQLSVEIRGLAPDAIRSYWSGFSAMAPAAPVIDTSGSVDELIEGSIRSWLLGEGNTLSVATSIRHARENARAIREYLTREVFELINQCWLHLDSGMAHHQPGGELIGQVQSEIFGISGAIGRTLIRDEAWSFLDIGAMLERVSRVVQLLKHRVPPLLSPIEDVDVPLHHALLRAVLRSAGSLENFRRVHGATLSAQEVSRFLMFEPQTPTSVAFGIAHLESDLNAIEQGGELTEPARLIGGVLAKLRYGREDLLSDGDFESVCEMLAADIAGVHDSLTRLYFTV